jgi:hypothetical protein
VKDSAVFECKYSVVCLGHVRAPSSVVSDTHADGEIGLQADPAEKISPRAKGWESTD